MKSINSVLKTIAGTADAVTDGINKTCAVLGVGSNALLNLAKRAEIASQEGLHRTEVRSMYAMKRLDDEVAQEAYIESLQQDVDLLKTLGVPNVRKIADLTPELRAQAQALRKSYADEVLHGIKSEPVAGNTSSSGSEPEDTAADLV